MIVRGFLPVTCFRNRFQSFGSTGLSVTARTLRCNAKTFNKLHNVPSPRGPKRVLLFQLSHRDRHLDADTQLLGCSLPTRGVRSILVSFIGGGRPRISFCVQPFICASSLNVSPQLRGMRGGFFICNLRLNSCLSPRNMSYQVDS